MPKTAAYSLFWQEEQQTYQLYLTKNKTLLDLSAGSPAWFLLLEQIDSLTFRGRNGHCTVRKESRKRGNGYWYAYQSRGKHLYKQYIGKAAHLTAERLEEVVQQLAARYNPPQGPPEQQSNPLLLAKFSVPHPQHQLVARTHLLEQIERGVQGPLTLISAPAGFGKTTILAQWFQQKKMPAVWLSLEAQDNHPTRFLRYVITALQQFDPELGRDLLVLLQSGRPAQTESLLTLLANEITTRCIPCIVLILDDYHVITAEAIHQQLAFFCEHPASRLRLVLLTRADPPLPLARLRAYGQLTELRASQLRFDSQETTAFLQSVMGLELSDDNLRLLEQRTEGWVAGLQLAALSLRGQTDVAAYLRDLGGSNRFILDYLSDEVISHLPASTLDFLLNTCILERLNDSLCAAVLQREPAQVRGMLASLERSNLFVIALDENGTWYRYHHLFSTMLQARLAQSYPGHSAELHRRASLWYQQNGYENEAMHHALLTRDISRVLELLKTSAWEMLQRGEHQLLLEWLERIPRQLEREQPLLCLYHAATLAFLTQIGAAQEMLHYAEHPLNREAELAPPGEIAAVRLLIASVKGDLDQAEQAAQLALSQLSPERNFLQRLVRGSQALMYARKGKCALAIEMLYAAAGPTWTIDQAVGLAYLYVELGRLQKTMSICQETLASLRKGGVPPSLPYLGAISILLGLVSYERNECEDALSFLHEGIEHCKKMGEPIFLSLGYIIIAHIRLFQHTFMQPCPEPDAEMLELVRQARDLLRQQRLEMYWVSSGAPWLLLRFFLACGMIEEAQQLVEEHSGCEELCAVAGVDYSLQMEAKAFAYLSLARRQPERTLELLAWPIQAAKEDRRISQLVSLFILQTKAYLALEQPALALESLEKALHFAEPGGQVRPFLEEGFVLLDLLLLLHKQLQSRAGRVSRAFVQTLLHWLDHPTATSQSPRVRKKDIPDISLTRSEKEVLRLIGAGFTNQDIARQMVIETGTVKWHIHRIYGKLQVRTRTQALLTAQERGLLD